MKNKPGHIAAFSMLEVTIVIALVALLSALFFGALNRFGEQVKNETQIRQELNDWFAVRSMLWRELDEADSLVAGKNSLVVYKAKDSWRYTIADDQLERTINETPLNLNIPVNYIRRQTVSGREYVQFGFDWKGQEMQLSYPLRVALADKVNTYFKEAQWQR